MAREIPLGSFGAARAKLAERFGAALFLGARLGALRGQAELVKATDAAGKVDRGGFKRGWKARAEKLGERTIVVRYWNDQPHAGPVDIGRRPGRRPPPVAVIQRWVTRKLGIRGKKARGVAYVIARAIGKRGIKGAGILAKTIPTLQAELVSEMKAAVHEAANR